MASWNFTDVSANGDGLEWTGEVAGPDRLRFLGMTSRYVALVSDISLKEAGQKVGAGGTAT
jgi:ABC-2 type transport system ATP-binding protein